MCELHCTVLYVECLETLCFVKCLVLFFAIPADTGLLCCNNPSNRWNRALGLPEGGSTVHHLSGEPLALESPVDVAPELALREETLSMESFEEMVSC